MRRLVVVSVAVALLGMSTRSLAGPDDLDKNTLSAKEVARYFAPYTDSVRACYVTHATNKGATGLLRLELVIHHHGHVFRFAFAAPGVARPNLAKLDACLTALSKTWRFPVRKGFTSAVLPFIYQKTNAPGAGPIESCWDPKGCPPGRTGKPRKKGTP